MVRPRWWRRACSNIGYTWIGRKIPSDDSASWFISTAEPIWRAGGVPSGSTVHSGVSPWARAAMRVRHASAPDSSTHDARPAAMSSAVWFSSICGELPPIADMPLSMGCPTPSRSATSDPGSW